jgi:hypothetical protein
MLWCTRSNIASYNIEDTSIRQCRACRRKSPFKFGNVFVAQSQTMKDEIFYRTGLMVFSADRMLAVGVVVDYPVSDFVADSFAI